MKKIFFLILITITVISACKKSHTDKPTVPIVVKTYNFDTLTTIVQTHPAQLGKNVGLLLMDKTGKILYKHYFGNYSDSTYLPIGSGSKWPSAAAVMTLVDNGSINLDDKITKFYPTEYAAADRQNITIRQLLSHTGGFESMLTNNPWLNFTAISLQDAVKGIGHGGNVNGLNIPAALVPFSPNGTKFAYGGTSPQVTGGIAEKVSGKTWDVFFKDNIGSKCNMPNTNYLALGPTTNYRIAGGMGTRMMEYANFLLMLINNGKFNGTQVLSAASVAEMLKDQTNGVPLSYTPYAQDPIRKNYRYGLGCWVEGYNNGKPSVFDDQGGFGFSPWIDTGRGVIGILFIKSVNALVDGNPTPYTAPYTLITNKIAAILDK